MRQILMSAGGTGGGVYPALAVAEALLQLDPNTYLRFAGSTRTLDTELIDNAPFRFDSYHRIQAGPVHGVSLLRKGSSLLRLLVGVIQSLYLLRRTKTNVVFLTGGWASLPVALAAWLLRTPALIYVPDIEPGRTLKLLGRFAHVIAATAPGTEKYYPKKKKVVATGYALRRDLLSATREAGIKHFGLEANKRTLLVFGGSQGSRAINRALLKDTPQLLEIPDLQILHVSGKLDAEEVRNARANLPPELQARYYTYTYIEEMGLAFAVADIALSRAGAGTLGEFPVFGLPAVLVPLAYSWRYQEVNADWLAERGAAIRLDEVHLSERLVPLLRELLNDKQRLEEMRAAMHRLARTDGAENIARLILAESGT